MSSKKIIFRADGNSKTGLGHLYRLFSLVEIVKDQIDFVFVTKEDSTTNVIPEHFNKLTIPNSVSIQEEPEWLQANFSPLNYVIIADGYQFTSSYQKHIKQRGYSLIYIDDLAQEHMYADVVINHSPYIQEKQYSKENYTQLALGTKFALLRPLFLKEAKKNKTIESVDHAFVCFGGADPFNLTIKAVEALLKFSNFKKIQVVLGGAYKHNDIFNLEDKYSHILKIHRNLSETLLLETMKQCNFAIAPASTILYELSCVKMPILSGFYVDNQELIYRGFLNSEAIFKGENMKDYSIFDFEYKIKTILIEQKFSSQINAQKALFDADIAKRHLKIIRDLC